VKDVSQLVDDDLAQPVIVILQAIRQKWDLYEVMATTGEHPAAAE
jgi:hypothetical protein